MIKLYDLCIATRRYKDNSSDAQDFSNVQDFTASTDFSPESLNPDEIPF